MTHKGGKTYSQADAEQFVKYLGLWWHPNPQEAAKNGKRSLQDYIKWLKLCAAQPRDDAIGAWERKAALNQLHKLI